MLNVFGVTFDQHARFISHDMPSHWHTADFSHLRLRLLLTISTDTLVMNTSPLCGSVLRIPVHRKWGFKIDFLKAVQPTDSSPQRVPLLWCLALSTWNAGGAWITGEPQEGERHRTWWCWRSGWRTTFWWRSYLYRRRFRYNLRHRGWASVVSIISWRHTEDELSGAAEKLEIMLEQQKTAYFLCPPKPWCLTGVVASSQVNDWPEALSRQVGPGSLLLLPLSSGSGVNRL